MPILVPTRATLRVIIVLMAGYRSSDRTLLKKGGLTISALSMCKDESCPSKLMCRRFTDPPHPRWQSYVDFGATRGQAAKCENFIHNKKNLDQGDRNSKDDDGN